MLHIHQGGRQSGKTSWLIKQYKKNPGIFVTALYQSSVFTQVKGSDLFIQLVSDVRADCPIYIDEIGDNDHVNYNTIIALDARGQDLYITGSLDPNKPGYKNLLAYLKPNYPEYII